MEQIGRRLIDWSVANDLDEILALAQKKKTPAQSRKILVQAGIFSPVGKLADPLQGQAESGRQGQGSGQRESAGEAKGCRRTGGGSHPRQGRSPKGSQEDRSATTPMTRCVTARRILAAG